jgi:putative membrane protein
VVTWFAGLFYLPRLMVYSAEANSLKDEHARNTLLKQYQIMKRRLLFGITWPSAIITFLLGMRMLVQYPLTNWLLLKLLFVLFLYFYMISLQIIFQQQEKGLFKYSGQQLRVWNEIPTVILFAIVFLVVLKNTTDFWWGLVGLLILIIVLILAIRLYKSFRENK